MKTLIEVLIIIALTIIAMFFCLKTLAQEFSINIERTDLPVTATVLYHYEIATNTTDLIITTNYKNVMLNASSENIIVNNKYIK